MMSSNALPRHLRLAYDCLDDVMKYALPRHYDPLQSGNLNFVILQSVPINFSNLETSTIRAVSNPEAGLETASGLRSKLLQSVNSLQSGHPD